MPRLLRNTAGRLIRAASGKLVTEGCADTCCGDAPRCASAVLCWTTDDYANVNPKVIKFPCPEDGKLCWFPSGNRLVAYRGRCYQPIYADEEGTLVCGTQCDVNGATSVWVEHPDLELTCLELGLDCTDHPCDEGWTEPTCCERRPLSCPADCGCDPDTECDCGKRSVYTYGGAWSNTIYAPAGYGNDHLVRCRTLRYTESVMAIVTYSGNCNNPTRDVVYFGGTLREVICHHESDFCPGCEETSEWIPAAWTPECGNLKANHAVQPGLGDACDVDNVTPCVAGQYAGIHIHQQGQRSCTWATATGFDRRYSQINCELGEETAWTWYAAQTTLIPCEGGRDGWREPPSLAELGMF